MINLTTSLNKHTCTKIAAELSTKGLANSSDVAEVLFQNFLSRNPEKNHSKEWFKNETQLIKGKIKQYFPEISDINLEFLCRKIARIEKSSYHVNTSSQLPKSETITPLAILSDFDGVDHNGAIISYLEEALLYGYPCITSRTLFTNALQAPNVKTQKTISADILRFIEKKYLIFTNGPFLVFIPTPHANQSLEEQLWRLDLEPERLTQISIKDTQECGKGYCTIDQFKALFSDRSAYDKIFWIAGHGGTNSPAGLFAENYIQLLDWMNKHRCKGMVVTSCLAGGNSSLLHLSRVKFPVILRSIGDFPTIGTARSRSQMETTKSTELPQLFAELIERPRAYTNHDIRNLIAIDEANSALVTQNTVQIYTPSPQGGFRTIPYSANILALTHTKYRTLQLRREIIAVSDALQVFLLMIDLPVKFTGSESKLLSMIPGNAHHFFAEISFAKITHKDFLKGIFSLQKNWGLDAIKVFFIAKLSSETNVWHQVFFNVKTGEYGYRDGDNYFFGNLNNDNAPIKVSGSSYYLLWVEAKAASIPEGRAVQVATSAQQEQVQVDQALEGSAFWGDRFIDWQEYAQFLNPEKIKHIEIEELSQKTQAWNLSESDKAHLVAYIVNYNENLACAYLELSDVEPSLSDMSGYPLIINAARGNHLQFMRLLLKLKVNVNQQTPSTGNTALVLALQRRFREFVALLLDQESIDVNIRNLSGVAAFTWAGSDGELLQMCKTRQPDLNFDLDGKALGPLATAIFCGDIQHVEMYVQAGANLNILSDGELLLTHALMAAPQLVEKLLKMGANPYKMIDNAVIPIIYAMEHSSSKIVEALLTIEIPQNDKDKLARRIFLEALRSGNENKIRAALKLNPTLLSNDPSHLKHFSNLFELCPCKEEERDLVEGFKKLVLFGHQNILKELCDRGMLNLRIIFDMIDCEKNDQEWRLILLKKIIELTNDPNQGLYMALRVDPAFLDTQPFIRNFIVGGANVNARFEPYDTRLLGTTNVSAKVEPLYTTKFAKLVTFGSVELIKLGLDRGATVFSFPRGVDAWQSVRLRTQEHDQVLTLLKQYGTIQVTNLMNRIMLLADKNQALQDIITLDQELLDREPYIRTCVEAGGDLNTPLNGDYSTVFAAIVSFGSLEFLEWCLNHKAQVYSAKFIPGQYPIDVAKQRKNDSEAALELLNKFNKADMQLQIGLMLDQAIKESNVVFLEQYMSMNLNYLCNNGTMPLIFGAIASMKSEIVAVVLKNKANLTPTYNGQTPLEFATVIGNQKILELIRAVVN